MLTKYIRSPIFETDLINRLQSINASFFKFSAEKTGSGAHSIATKQISPIIFTYRFLIATKCLQRCTEVVSIHISSCTQGGLTIMSPYNRHTDIVPWSY